MDKQKEPEKMEISGKEEMPEGEGTAERPDVMKRRKHGSRRKMLRFLGRPLLVLLALIALFYLIVLITAWI